MNTPPVDRDILQEMTDVLVAAANPERVILFGSQAGGGGAVTEHSDVDLLVVESEPFGAGPSRLDEMRRLRRALRSFRGPKDVLVYSPEEFDKWRRTTNHVVARAVREGEVLYERA
ncbi:MAG: nucleotidyltransferase domain-containing protein [Bacteroidetes bacterium SW_4_67_19]|jgi:predicted nucleotidyltransferase|nr:MAG: nucleotidyltransferase domain-containing protein [Bacteroidetes bacterium SW_4_67_19]